MVASRITPDQRFTRWHPCPICEGFDAARRGRGERCAGFLSDDGRFAFCTREEYAGALDARQTAAGPTYKHLLEGPCHCGHEHGAPLPFTPRPKPSSEPAPAKPQSGPLPRLHKGATLAAEYAYRRADGSLAYRVARYEFPLKPGEVKRDKTFSQVRQLDASTWAWGLGETERLLYRLPEILAAPAHRPVVIVEGEKCADALAALGVVVTTCPEGAGKWGNVPGRHEALNGRQVVILPDQDEKGRAHARAIAEDLADVAAAVRLVELPNLPPKGDAVEWIAAGGTALQLLELALATPAYQQASDSTPSQENCPAGQVDSPGANTPTAAALKIAETTVHNLRARDAWESKVRANSQVRGNYKPMMAHIRDEWDSRRGREPDGYMRVYRPKWAERLGMSEKAVSQHIDRLAECGAIEKRVEKTYDPATGLARNHISIRPTETLLQRPEALAMPGWGGKRAPICEACGSEDLRERRTVYCGTCGTVQSTTERLLSSSSGESDDAGDSAEYQAADSTESRNPCPAGQVDSPGKSATEGGELGAPEYRAGGTPYPPSARYESVPKLFPREAGGADTFERPPADVWEHMTSRERIAAYEAQGMPFDEAVRRVDAENHARKAAS